MVAGTCYIQVNWGQSKRYSEVLGMSEIEPTRAPVLPPSRPVSAAASALSFARRGSGEQTRTRSIVVASTCDEVVDRGLQVDRGPPARLAGQAIGAARDH